MPLEFDKMPELFTLLHDTDLNPKNVRNNMNKAIEIMRWKSPPSEQVFFRENQAKKTLWVLKRIWKGRQNIFVKILFFVFIHT